MALFSLNGTGPPNGVNFPSNFADADMNAPTVRLQLCFARTFGTNATGLSGHTNPLTGQAWQHVSQLGQFHLQLSFTSARPSGEDVQNQLGAINHPGIQHLVQVALLRWAQFLIENYEICVLRLDGGQQFFCFS